MVVDFNRRFSFFSPAPCPMCRMAYKIAFNGCMACNVSWEDVFTWRGRRWNWIGIFVPGWRFCLRSDRFDIIRVGRSSPSIDVNSILSHSGPVIGGVIDIDRLVRWTQTMDLLA